MRNPVAASPTKRRRLPSQARVFSRRALLILATRATITSLLSTAAPSLARYAQAASKLPRVGLLIIGSLNSPESREAVEAMRQGLREHGYVEGRNITIEYRSADGDLERLQSLAAELVRLNVDVIVAGATPAGLAAQQATATIPVIVPAMGDPVGDGLVASLARPGGNITGTTFLGPRLVPKHLELLREALPRANSIAVIWHPNAFAQTTMVEMLQEAEAAAKVLGIRLHFIKVGQADELESAFSTMAAGRPDAVLVFPSVMLFAERKRIAALARKYRLFSMFNNWQAVELGGAMGYGASIVDLVQRTGTFVDRVLKGAHPADLPVEQPTKFELAINVKTVKMLGVTIPESLRQRADRLFE